MLKLVKSWADRNVSVTLLLLSPSKSLTWHQLVKQAASQRGPGARLGAETTPLQPLLAPPGLRPLRPASPGSATKKSFRNR